MKFTATHRKQLEEYLSLSDDGVTLTVDLWTSGKGRYTSRRALPPFVREYTRDEFWPRTYPACNADGRRSERPAPERGTDARAAYDWLKANPRRQKVLVLDRAAMWAFLTDAARGCEL